MSNYVKEDTIEHELELLEKAVDNALVPTKDLESEAAIHMRYAVKFYILNKIVSQQANQDEIDYLIKQSKTAQGVAELFEKIIILAVESCDIEGVKH